MFKGLDNPVVARVDLRRLERDNRLPGFYKRFVDDILATCTMPNIPAGTKTNSCNNFPDNTATFS